MKKVVQTILSLGIGAILGGIMLWTIGFDNLDRMSFFKFVVCYLLMGFGVYAILIFSTIIHEAGHLVCGLMSGYKYLNFRILSYNFCKYEDGFKLKRFSIPGTGGQCLMAPPEYDDGNFKYKLYLAGGNIATFILFIIEVVVFAFIGIHTFVGRVVLLASVISLYLLILNAIPLQLGGVPNDALDLKSLGKNPKHKKEFWMSLDVNAKNHNGLQMSEVGIDFDAIDDDELLKEIDGIAIQIKLNIKVNYLVSMKRYEEAYVLCKKLIDEKAVVDLYRCELNCDKMFLEIMLGKVSKAKKTYSNILKEYINKTHKFMIQRMRLMYAYYLLLEKDESKALEEKKCFEKACLSYPDLGEVKSERKLMEYIELINNERLEAAQIMENSQNVTACNCVEINGDGEDKGTEDECV